MFRDVVTSERKNKQAGAITLSASDSTRTARPDEAANEPHAFEERPLAPIQYRDPGRYTIICEHGRGGLGRVSRARDRELGRDVAIKELIQGTGPGEIRFLREALITARLEHPGIVPIHEAGRWPDGTPFYAMKLVAGRSLKELLSVCASIDERFRLLDHVIAVADAIAYAHNCKIIHRDLKPANVIVGEFGETVVIDWGLAKDLAATEDPQRGDGPYRINHIDDLTTTGAVLGTPAYMAPEQERGEQVDERADVFSIGAMLWEVCSNQRVPPNDPRQRNRLLRRAGIDPDLAAIVGKALHPERSRRYRNAGEMAADLNAFRAGARIGARRYSIFAMLGHWTRRHRGLAVSAAVLLVATIASGIIYVRNITFERDRADAALVRADAEREAAVQARDALALRHAQVLLHIDPTAAIELLATYRGRDSTALELARARAKALGVSRTIAVPHTGRILFAHALPDRYLLSIGDHTVVKTSMLGQTRIVANNMTPQRESSYVDSRHLLAFACDSISICILDAISERVQKIESDVTIPAPDSLNLSPDGNLLAASSEDGRFAIWNISNMNSPSLSYQSKTEAGPAVRFVGNTRIVTITASHMTLFDIENPSAPRRERTTSISGAYDADAKQDGSLLAVATLSGVLELWDLHTGSTRNVTLCQGAMNSARFLMSGTRIAYACQDGNAGIWDASLGENLLSTHLEGGAATVAVSDDDRYWVIGGSSGVLQVYDFHTEMFNSYLGHAVWISQVIPPSVGFPYVASADRNGVLRVWDLPGDSVHVAVRSRSRLISAVLVSNHGPVLATGISAALRWASFDGRTGELGGHYAGRMAVALSPSTASVSMYMGDAIIEQWSFTGTPTQRLINTDHGEVTALRYLADGESFVSGGRDGRIVTWSRSGAHREIARLDEPVESIRLMGSNGTLVVRGVHGTFRKIDSTGMSPVADETGFVSRYAISADGSRLAVITPQDRLHVYDTQTWVGEVYPQPFAKLSDLAFSSEGDQLALATESGVSVISVKGGLRRLSEFDIRVASLAYSSEGRWLALTGVDGALWFYSLKDRHWYCEGTGPASIFYGQFAPDGRHFVATDSGGRALLVDMSQVK